MIMICCFEVGVNGWDFEGCVCGMRITRKNNNNGERPWLIQSHVFARWSSSTSTIQLEKTRMGLFTTITSYHNNNGERPWLIQSHVFARWSSSTSTIQLEKTRMGLFTTITSYHWYINQRTNKR